MDNAVERPAAQTVEQQAGISNNWKFCQLASYAKECRRNGTDDDAAGWRWCWYFRNRGIIGRSFHKYKCCRDNVFAATKHVFGRDKSMLVATNICHTHRKLCKETYGVAWIHVVTKILIKNNDELLVLPFYFFFFF